MPRSCGVQDDTPTNCTTLARTKSFNGEMQYKIDQKAKEMQSQGPAIAVLMFNSISLLLTCTREDGFATPASNIDETREYILKHKVHSFQCCLGILMSTTLLVYKSSKKRVCTLFLLPICHITFSFT